jgi:peptidoglycan hydrolase CwlO-like protein
MWPFFTLDTVKMQELEKENEQQKREIKSINAVVDDLVSREQEQKGVFHYTVQEKENKIKDLQSKINDLEETIADMKHMGKRVKKSKE